MITRDNPPNVCCTPMYSPRSLLEITRDSIDVTHGKVKAVPRWNERDGDRERDVATGEPERGEAGREQHQADPRELRFAVAIHHAAQNSGARYHRDRADVRIEDPDPVFADAESVGEKEGEYRHQSRERAHRDRVDPDEAWRGLRPDER